MSFTATEIHYAFRGWLVTLLVLAHSGVSPMPFLPQESTCISSAGIAFTTIRVARVQKLASTHFISPGEWRVVTPAGIARVRRSRRVVFSRRLRPCPRKASTRSDPGRREMHVLIEKNQQLLHSLYQLRGLKGAKLIKKRHLTKGRLKLRREIRSYL